MTAAPTLALALTCSGCGRRLPEAVSGPATLEILAVAVPGEIARMKLLPLSQAVEVARSSAQTVAEHGDELLFGGKRAGATFAALSRGLAALSFAPGGVVFQGMHWCAVHPENAATDGQYSAARSRGGAR